MNKYYQYFLVRGIEVEITADNGCKIHTNNLEQSKKIMDYLKHEGFFDKQNEMVVA